MRIDQLVTQTGADTTTSAAIQTGLTSDGKAGWNIFAIEAFWVDGAAVAAGDYTASAIISTINTATTYGSDDEIARLSWGCQNTAGVAVAVPFEPVKGKLLNEPRLTVQPTIYAQVQSSATAQANDMIVVIYYEIVKLTDVEVLRLLAGGA